MLAISFQNRIHQMTEQMTITLAIKLELVLLLSTQFHQVVIHCIILRRCREETFQVIRMHFNSIQSNSFEENYLPASSRYMKKRKMNDSTGTSETIGTSKTSVRLNGYSPDKKEECNCAAGKKVKKRIDAEEKWWIAQYALYSKLNRAQKFEMRKTISELQFKFEYENLANAEPEILLKTDQNSENELTSDDDPLQW